MHINGHEVTTKNISGVDSGISRNRMTGFDQYASVGLKHSIYTNCSMYAETNAVCGSIVNEAKVQCVLNLCA